MKRHPVNRPPTKHATESGLIPISPEDLSAEKERLVELLARFLWFSWRDQHSAQALKPVSSPTSRTRPDQK